MAASINFIFSNILTYENFNNNLRFLSSTLLFLLIEDMAHMMLCGIMSTFTWKKINILLSLKATPFILIYWRISNRWVGVCVWQKYCSKKSCEKTGPLVRLIFLLIMYDFTPCSSWLIYVKFGTYDGVCLIRVIWVQVYLHLNLKGGIHGWWIEFDNVYLFIWEILIL